jgi:hypothetical protein
MGKRKEGRKMDSGISSLNNVIGKLQAQGRFTSARVAELFNTKLVETSHNEYFAFLEGTNARFDVLQIDKVDLRLRLDGEPHAGFLVLRIANPCIKKGDIMSQYTKLTLSSAPRGRSDDEETSYVRDDAWGRISFGFAENNPECLASVALDPKS